MTLPYQKIKDMTLGVNPMIFSSGQIDEVQIQNASLDVTIGHRAYRVVSSFLPQPHETIDDVLRKHTLYSFDILPGTVLEKHACYIIPLQEGFHLPSEIYAMSNPKSSIGRIDVFVRLLTDHNQQYDYIPRGYHGPLYIEVIPLSFVISIAPGLSLNQIRFRTDENELVGDLDLKLAHSRYGLVFDADKNAPVPPEQLQVRGGTVVLTADLKNREIVGWRAKPSSAVIDLTKHQALDASICWEPIHATEAGELILMPNMFYLLASRERVRVPHEFAAEVMPYEPQSGEFRTHYAGFFDAGFGYGDQGELPGSAAVLEVRAHTTPFRLTHGQVICKLVYERLSEPPTKVYSAASGSYYTDLGPKLAKFFKNTW